MAVPVTRNLTILLTDIKEFTTLTSNKSRADILKMLERHKQTVLPVLQSRGGRLIKTIGDAFLVVFDSPTDAVLAGIAVQDALTEYNRGKEAGDRLDVRIAINVGEVNISDNDIFGDPVNITARIESIAEAGEVFFTEAVYLSMNKTEVPSSEVGMLQLKGLPEKVRVYKVVREHPVEDLPGGEKSTHIAAPPAAVPGAAAPKPAAAAPAPVSASTPAEGEDKPKKGRRIPWRRIAALAIDVVICSIIVDTLFKTEQQTVQVQTSQEDVQREVAKAMQEVGKALPSDMKVKLSEDGIEISASKTPREPKARLESKAVEAEGEVHQAEAEARRVEADRMALEEHMKANRHVMEASQRELDELMEKLKSAEGEERGQLKRRAREAEKRMKKAHREMRRTESKAKRLEQRMHKIEKAAHRSREKARNFRIQIDGQGVRMGTEEQLDEGAEKTVLYDKGGMKVVHKKEKKNTAFALFWVVYSSFFLSLWAATPGAKILKLKVVKVDGGPIDWRLGLVRSLFTIVSASVVGLGFLWGLWERDRRGWHDLIAGTKVVANGSL